MTAIDWVLAALVALLGLAVGSFLNVVIYRVPKSESVVRPRSHCPSCGTELAERDNIPVLSWLLLRGRCRTCHQPISARYPLVELLTAGVFLVMLAQFGFTWQLPAYLYLVAIGVALAFIDIDAHRLPDAITLPSYPVLALLLLLPTIASGDWGDYVRALLAAAALFAFYFALVLVYPAGMGFGDVKLAGLLGLMLGYQGWGQVVVGGFLGFAIGSVVGVTVMLATRSGRKTKIPFGPSMLVGALLALIFGGSLWSSYVGTFS